MSRILIYAVLGMVLLLSSFPFVSNGWTVESDVISFIFRDNGNSDLYLMDIRGEVFRHITFRTVNIYGHTWSPDGGSFAYVSGKNGDLEIYVMDVKRKKHRRLTHHFGRDSEPAWSPNGKWITFISDRAGDTDIYRMDANGKNVKKLTNQGECNKPTWSPDSQSIAFTSSSEGEYFMYVMGADGKRLRRLVGGMSIPGCSWSPDGKQIAFISRGAERGMDIFSIDIDGKNLRQLTWLDQGAFIFRSPAWSPSGKWIAYVLSELIGPLKPVLLPEDFEKGFETPVVCVVNTVDGGVGKPIETTRELGASGSMNWVPEEFFSVSPSSEKQTTLWGRLKQMEDAPK